MSDRPSVMFVCVHNAGRSQMAAGYATALSGGRVEVRSAGSIPADQINPIAVDAMAELGIDPDAVARTIAFAIEQPRDVEISEIVVRPTRQG